MVCPEVSGLLAKKQGVLSPLPFIPLFNQAHCKQKQCPKSMQTPETILPRSKSISYLPYLSKITRIFQKSVKRYATDQESAKITNKKSYHIPITVHTFHEVLVSDRPSAYASGRKNGFSPQALSEKRCDGADCFCQRIALPNTSSQTDALR